MCQLGGHSELFPKTVLTLDEITAGYVAWWGQSLPRNHKALGLVAQTFPLIVEGIFCAMVEASPVNF